MPSKIVYPNGNVEATLIANESIAVFSRGEAKVSRVLGYPNHPESVSLLGVVNNGETVFGPYATGAVIVIEAGAAGANYEQGISPVVSKGGLGQLQGTPVALNATGSITAASMLGGIVTSTTAAAVAGTVPTGTVMDAADTSLAIGDSFDWYVINTGPNTFTVTAAAGHTLVGVAAVVTVTSAHFRTLKTAAATYVTYRLS